MGALSLAVLLAVDLLGLGGIALRAGLAVAGLAALGGALLFLRRACAAVDRLTRVNRAVAAGDFEARVIGIHEGGALGD
ncbi:hypothetical protein [Azospirillum sp. B506]|uniref:hypothetical protein n=1 Tax=Azospirillum sp. B506 TaxID=137721 RepID=UPI00034AC204|nr:hypothetical protein [Azospirillum sp. B506]